MVAVLRKNIMRLMMTDVSCQGFGCTGEVCTNSRGEKGQITVPKRLAKYGWWKFQQSILTLVRRTHALIIGNSLSNQEVHKETSTPRRSVWGFGYYCASSTHGTWGYSIYYNPSRG